MRARQRLAAYALLIDGQGRLLLTRQPQGRGPRLSPWLLPGGGVEPGEHPEQAVVREVLEETGWPVTVGALRHVLSDVTVVGRRRRVLHNVRLIYQASIVAPAGSGPAGSGPAGSGPAGSGPAAPDAAGPGTAEPPGGCLRWCTPAQCLALPLDPFTALVLDREAG